MSKEVELHPLWQDVLTGRANRMLTATRQRLGELMTALPQRYSAESAAAAAVADARNVAQAALSTVAQAHRAALRAEGDDHRSLVEALDVAAFGDWDDPRWDDFRPDPEGPLLHQIRFGAFRDTVARDGALPWVLPLVGSRRPIGFITDRATSDMARDIMRSLVLRLVALMPFEVRFAFLDPRTTGAFPMQSALKEADPALVRETADLVPELQRISQQIRRIKTDVVRYAGSFEEVDRSDRRADRFEFVFAPGFPDGYSDRRALEELEHIARAGATTGRYLILEWNKDLDKPRDFTPERFEGMEWIDLTTEPKLGSFRREIDPLPDPERQQRIIARAVSETPRPSVSQDFGDVAMVPEGQWWTASSAETLETDIGRELKVWLGQKDGIGHCPHGIIAGQPGSGKSNLFHVLLTGLAIRYSPRELRFLLIDGKSGVEFEPYRALPHAQVVSLHTSPAMARSVVREMVEEMERRYRVFQDAGVQSLGQYRKAVPGAEMPRLLLLVDEYQQLFDGEPEEASDMLRRLAEQGRAAGVHMLLASQRFTAQGMLRATAILNNIPLRIGLQMSLAEATSLTEFGPKGKQLIKDLGTPGQAVVNDRGGNDDANMRGMIAVLTKERRTALLDALARKAQAEGLRPQAVVFDGTRRPEMSENAHLRAHWTHPPAPEALEETARRSKREGGFGIARWLAAEQPLGLWLGREFNVHGHALAMLRRGNGQNLAVVGADPSVRPGLVAGAVAGLRTMVAPAALTVDLLDGIPDGLTGAGLLAAAGAALTEAGIAVRRHDEDGVAALLDDLEADLKARGSTGRGAPSRLVVIQEPERWSALNRGDSATYARVRTLLREGSKAGLHIVVSASGYRLLDQIMDARRDLTAAFEHRVALQMSEQESRDFIDVGEASTLDLDPQAAPAALYVDTASSARRGLRFTPYALDKAEALAAALRRLT